MFKPYPPARNFIPAGGLFFSIYFNERAHHISVPSSHDTSTTTHTIPISIRHVPDDKWIEVNFKWPTVKLEVQLLHRLPPPLERSGKGGGRRWKPGIRVIRQYKIKKGDLCLPRINYFCIVYEV